MQKLSRSRRHVNKKGFKQGKIITEPNIDWVVLNIFSIFNLPMALNNLTGAFAAGNKSQYSRFLLLNFAKIA